MKCVAPLLGTFLSLCATACTRPELEPVRHGESTTVLIDDGWASNEPPPHIHAGTLDMNPAVVLTNDRQMGTRFQAINPKQGRELTPSQDPKVRRTMDIAAARARAEDELTVRIHGIDARIEDVSNRVGETRPEKKATAFDLLKRATDNRARADLDRASLSSSGNADWQTLKRHIDALLNDVEDDLDEIDRLRGTPQGR
jgi:hypothetical protein